MSSNRDATRDSHTEGSQSVRERHTPQEIPYTWNLITATNQPSHRKQTRGEQTCGGQGGMGGGGRGLDGEVGVSRCKLWH